MAAGCPRSPVRCGAEWVHGLGAGGTGGSLLPGLAPTPSAQTPADPGVVLQRFQPSSPPLGASPADCRAHRDLWGRMGGLLGFTPLAMKRGGYQMYHSLQRALAHPMPPNVLSNPRRAAVTEQRPPWGPTALLALVLPSLNPSQLRPAPRVVLGCQGLPTRQETWAQTTVSSLRVFFLFYLLLFLWCESLPLWCCPSNHPAPGLSPSTHPLPPRCWGQASQGTGTHRHHQLSQHAAGALGASPTQGTRSLLLFDAVKGSIEKSCSGWGRDQAAAPFQPHSATRKFLCFSP